MDIVVAILLIPFITVLKSSLVETFTPLATNVSTRFCFTLAPDWKSSLIAPTIVLSVVFKVLSVLVWYLVDILFPSVSNTTSSNVTG